MQKSQLLETKEEGKRTLKIVWLDSNNIKEFSIIFFFYAALDV